MATDIRSGILASALAGALGAALACGGDRDAGTIEGARRPDASLAAQREAQAASRQAVDALAGGPRELPAKRILFGDLHVHTTYSVDAFMMSLPLLAGEGAHPPADACDFARYCSQVDFFALTDHAEAITPEHWAAEKESVRQCNARAGDPADPDVVAFTGFEWTQVGATPETHFGHKNVIFPDTAEDRLPARPISALPDEGQSLFAGIDVVRGVRWVDPLGWGEYSDFLWFLDRMAAVERCPKDVPTRELPLDCHENAPTPDVLFEKLRQWDQGALVIPHGSTWGFYTPPTTSMDKQLTRAYHDAGTQRLIEVMSGHGNSEEYRDLREWTLDAAGNPVCPEPSEDYLPCCWRAGQIMRQRCGELSSEECEARVGEAMRLAMEANVAPHLVFPDTTAADWLDCGQCRDCFKPALGYRPKESVQYSLALSNFAEPQPDGGPLRFRYGFIASSDNHKARPGTGYKQYGRRAMTEGTGVRSEFFMSQLRSRLAGDADPAVPQRVEPGVVGLFRADVERVASFLYPGGLVAVHAEGGSRQAIWQSLLRREVYGTSGPRILLWFDLLNGPDGAVPMGSEVALAAAPRFQVRAVGAFEQLPGCAEESVEALSSDRLEKLCRGECHNPSAERHRIAAIEIVRIQPQAAPGEDVAGLIEDPWLKFVCTPSRDGCVVTFEDPEYAKAPRDTVYYARAVQEPTPAVNGANLRTEFDSAGNPTHVRPCYGDYRTDFSEDCLAPVAERAWSSPIYVDARR
jgi:hypothetical protein